MHIGDAADSLSDENLDPFFKVDKKSKADKLEWLNRVKDSLIEKQKPLTSKQRLHLSAYRGVSLKPYDRRREYESIRRFNKINKFVVNHLYDLTETKVSQMTRLKPAVEVLPTNGEYEDRGAAKVVGYLIRHLWDLNNVDYIMQQMHRAAKIFGESYLFVLWNKDKGDLAPQWTQTRDMLDEIEKLTGEKKNKIETDGEIVFERDNPMKTGDIDYQLEVPWRVLLQPKSKIEDVEYCIRIAIEPTEDLKKEYGSKAKEIEAEDDLRVFDPEDLEDKFIEQHSIVYHFYHKYTKNQDFGKYIKFTKEAILEETSLPFTHGNLPFIRLTDLDVPTQLHGVSRYETVLPLQRMYDNISTLIAKNIYLTAHAKWMMPRGAAKIEQLGNDNTIVQYQGPVAPTLAQVASNPPEVYQFREQIKQDMQTVYGSHGISRGEVPKGITAASALQFLNELENERSSTDISKHGFLVKDLAKMTIAVCGDYYDINDGRMIRIVGKNNQFLIRHFDSANLNKNYDIRFDNSTGLPETKAAKIQRVMDTLQRNPTLFSPERWEQLLDLGDSESRVNLATEAVRSADSENEDIMSERVVALPEEWEEHIAHWRSHVKAMQSRTFKEEASNAAVDAMKQHVFITEKLMLDKASRNPNFQAQLATLPNFPIFHHAAPAPMSAEHQQAMVEGQANRGEAISGQIPGTPIEDIERQRNE